MAALFVCAAILPLSATRLEVPTTRGERALGRRHALEVASGVILSAAAGSTLAWLEGPTGTLGIRAASRTDPSDLRSVNELAELAREAQVASATAGMHASRTDAREATLRLLACAAQLDRAMELAKARRWDDISALAQAVREEVEASVGLVMASEVANPALRAEVGWEWGHCGWRHCGIEADVVQTLCKLREGLGLFVPAEARLYIDVARRGLDELLRVLGEEGGLLRADERAWLDARVYLGKDDLDAVLGEDGAPNGEEWEL
jgi:hypothetical protein